MQVLGLGKIGEALRLRAEARGVAMRAHRRGWTSDQLGAGPLLVLVRSDDLDGLLAEVPEGRREDLVLVQNGALHEWCQRNAPRAMRGVLHFAVSAHGDLGRAAGASLFAGRHAEEVAGWLTRLDVPARAVRPEALRVVELEKLVWNASFGLLCEVYGRSVGELLERQGDEVVALVTELAEVGAEGLALAEVPSDLIPRLWQETAAIGSYHAAIRDWRWRNGWFVAVGQRLGRPMPEHERLVAAWRGQP